MKHIALILILVLSVTVSCSKRNDRDKYAELKKAEWMIGRWENKLDFGTLTEDWEKVNDSTFSGVSMIVKDSDTLHFETISLVKKNGIVVYSPTVQGQNSNKPTDLKMTSQTEKQIVFENPSHDYPQKISYTFLTNDSIVAEISGKQQGKPSAEKYPLKKI